MSTLTAGPAPAAGATISRPRRTCTIDGCGRPHFARGWCDPHYRRWRRHGDPLAGRYFRTTCQVDNCPRPHVARGWCAMHDQRVRRTGDPERYDGDVDEIAVARAVMGDPPEHLTRAEREQVVRRLHREGYTDGRIADCLDIGTSGVQMMRARLRLAANAPGRTPRAERPA